MEKEVLRKINDTSENILVDGSINTGKTGNVLLPLTYEMIQSESSLLIIDSKEEYYKSYKNRLNDENYNVVVLNLRDLKHTDTYNPLEVPYDLYKKGLKDEAIDYLEDISKSIFCIHKGDPFWTNSAASLFVGITLGLFEDAHKNEINLSSIYNFLNSDNHLIEKYFKLKNKKESSYLSASSIIFSPKDTKESILAVTKDKLRKFVLKESLNNFLAKTNFKFSDLINKKSAIFIITKDEVGDINSLGNIFINQLYRYILDNKNSMKYNFILDNYETLGHIDNLYNMLNASLFRDINFSIGIKNKTKFFNDYEDIKTLLTVFTMEENSIKIDRNGNISKTLRGRNLLKKDIYYREISYKEVPKNKYELFDLENYILIKTQNMFDDKIQSVTKHIDKGIDVVNKKVDNMVSDISIDDLIKKIDQKISELSSGKSKKDN